LSWQVYIIRTEAGKLYTGITTDINRRFEEHLHSRKGARFFNFSNPKIILFLEEYPCRSTATKREREIKKMNLHQKLKLIASNEVKVNYRPITENA
jgi:putative endonuclease